MPVSDRGSGVFVYMEKYIMGYHKKGEVINGNA